MDKSPEDEIVITAMMKRFADHRLPRALDLEKKVLKGEVLNDNDLTFLDAVFNDAKYVLSLADKYPEYQELVVKAIQLYADITQKALENSKRNKKS
ncbi:hypothetical protein [Candidatus Berkiella aquae]|uniref:Uncharacterized protein n=1 Tax=Candidatus Berkiella aquae TaxID=295108 RepID=A0A0Q9YXA6_9GAMM|nr:hypothetical protein [Candidatus Berkiella aquae]MCS5710638.1 hypothetical protein [Candidatus Berkiella aquae]